MVAGWGWSAILVCRRIVCGFTLRLFLGRIIWLSNGKAFRRCGQGFRQGTLTVTCIPRYEYLR